MHSIAYFFRENTRKQRFCINKCWLELTRRSLEVSTIRINQSGRLQRTERWAIIWGMLDMNINTDILRRIRTGRTIYHMASTGAGTRRPRWTAPRWPPPWRTSAPCTGGRASTRRPRPWRTARSERGQNHTLSRYLFTKRLIFWYKLINITFQLQEGRAGRRG